MKTTYVCKECGHKESKWMGCCSHCRTWNSFIESDLDIKESKIKKSSRTQYKTQKPISINKIQISESERLKTEILELDRVFGGGIVLGSLSLISGEPGVGKSTLLMQLCASVSKIKPEGKILYISGEESASQISSRCKRLGIETNNILVLQETNWEKIEKQLVEVNPFFIILDSIQTTITHDLNSSAGSANQVKGVTYHMMNYCKSREVTGIIIGHVTKDGSIAGPKVLEHMVDTVLSFEGDESSQNRFLRVLKNRFGSTNEIGIFSMSKAGLSEVKNPSLLSGKQSVKSFGLGVSCLVEGRRPLMAEIQTLVVDNQFGNPRRTAQGYDQNRLNLLIAIVEKYLGISMSQCDIYLNTGGGLKIRSMETDLAVISSLLSSYRSQVLDSRTAYLGEVSLTGEIKAIQQIEERVHEVYAHGYTRVILPHANLEKLGQRITGVSYIGVKQINELSEFIF